MYFLWSFDSSRGPSWILYKTRTRKAAQSPFLPLSSPSVKKGHKEHVTIKLSHDREKDSSVSPLTKSKQCHWRHSLTQDWAKWFSQQSGETYSGWRDPVCPRHTRRIAILTPNPGDKEKNAKKTVRQLRWNVEHNGIQVHCDQCLDKSHILFVTNTVIHRRGVFARLMS